MAVESKIYFREKGSDWEYLGSTLYSGWTISEYGLKPFTIYEWRVDTYDTVSELETTGDTWTFIIKHSFSFPYSRNSDYDSNLFWDEGAGEWKELEFATTGGGRYKNRFVSINDQGQIYFGSI